MRQRTALISLYYGAGVALQTGLQSVLSDGLLGGPGWLCKPHKIKLGEGKGVTYLPYLSQIHRLLWASEMKWNQITLALDQTHLSLCTHNLWLPAAWRKHRASASRREGQFPLVLLLT